MYSMDIYGSLSYARSGPQFAPQDRHRLSLLTCVLLLQYPEASPVSVLSIQLKC